MPDEVFNFTSPEGKKYKVTGPEGATKEQAWQILQQQLNAPKPEGRLARIGHGLADPIYGAAQIGARMEEPTAFSTEEERQARIGAVDTTVQQREQQIQARRAPQDIGKTDWYRALGSVPTAAALSAPAAGLGPVGGAIVGGALGSVLQPETDVEHFGEHKGVEAAIGGALGAVGAGLGKVGSAVIQYVRKPENTAIAQLSRAAERDGTTVQQLQQRLTEIRRIRPQATIADVAGENVRGLVERIGQTPGAGVAKVAPRFTERQQAQLGRVAEDLRSLTGTSRTAYQAIESTMAGRAATARPLYEKALQEGDKLIFPQELERLSGSDAVQAAMHTAVTEWRDNAIANGYGAMNPGALVKGGNLEFLHGKVPVFPNLQFWDYTKNALDNMVKGSMQNGIPTKRTQTLTKLASDLRKALDDPEMGLETYKAARQAWAGPTKYLDAIEEGRGILSRAEGSEEMAARFSNLSEPEQEAYRIGAISALRARMGNDAAKLADFTKLVRSPEMRAKISAIMPTPEAAERWINSLEYEIRASELTGQALKGSPTARRLAQQADADTITGDLVLTALTHEPTLGALTKIFRHITPKVRDTLRSRSDNILIDLLTTPEGAARIPEKMPGPGRIRRALDVAAGPLAAGKGSLRSETGLE
jgi:hypothetical protein